jgi:hypothetical protein
VRGSCALNDTQAPKQRKTVWRSASRALSAELLDALLERHVPKAVLDSCGLTDDLKEALAESMPNTERDVHLSSTRGPWQAPLQRRERQ